MTSKILTQSELKKRLHYNPKTGIFIYLIKNTRNNIGDIAGKNRYRYATIMLDGQSYLCHRLAWLYMYGEFPKLFIDHINHNKLDNRITNLRECTNAQNQMNRGMSSKNTSGYKNVVFRAYCNSWQVVISINGVRISLGYFKTAEEANEVRIMMELKNHKEFYFNDSQPICLQAESAQNLS
jgi:HNH endonuclease